MVKEESLVPSRSLNIKTTEDKLQAYLSISYSHNPAEGQLPIYKPDELRKELTKLGIVYGVIEENLIKCTSAQDIQDILIAKGKEPVPSIDDTMEIKFSIDSEIKKLNEDSRGRVDFKSIGAVKSVKKGEIIAVRLPGVEGCSGINIFGKEIKHKPSKKLNLKAASGCQLLDENTVAASIDGKPFMKNNSFYVYKLHEISGDVDLKTGNIIFSEDIIIHGNVLEGMKVQAGNSVTVKQNVERATIIGKGDVFLGGNTIGSKVLSGGEDSQTLSQIKNLNSLEENLTELIKAVEEIKNLNLLGQDLSDGQIIKLLIENKFKSLYKLCLDVLTAMGVNLSKNELQEDKLFNLIKTKLIGLQPLTIKHYYELINILKVIKEKKELLVNSLALPVNVKVGYLQDSTVNSSGDIIVSGKGSYLSILNAHGSIYFTQEKSVVRGGILKASKEIKCKIIGSIGGAATKLCVEDKGHIWAEIAYENTIFAVGKREYSMEHPSKNVHVYIDHKNELIIDKLKL